MARKSKGFGELVRQQKREKAGSKSLEKFQKSFKHDFGTDLITVKEQQGIAKMSDVLKEFVRPYADIPQNIREIRHLIQIGVTAWNLALLPEKERIKTLDKIFVAISKNLKNIDQEDITSNRAVIEDLVARKLKHFANNQRQIIDFQLEDLGQDGYHLSVASTMPQ
jgi:hypothetical protein